MTTTPYAVTDLERKNMDLGPIAQLVEHRVDNAGVSGSSPLGPTIKNQIANIKIDIWFLIL